MIVLVFGSSSTKRMNCVICWLIALFVRLRGIREASTYACHWSYAVGMLIRNLKKKHLFRLEQQKEPPTWKRERERESRSQSEEKNTVYNFGNETFSRVCLALTLRRLHPGLSGMERCENEKRNIIVKMLNKGYWTSYNAKQFVGCWVSVLFRDRCFFFSTRLLALCLFR